MKTLPVLAFLPLALAAPAAAQLKVLVSVDMEGIAGVAHYSGTSESQDQYSYFRRIMTKEANAAIEGALAAGATTVIVRDAHGSKRNLLPEELHQEALLVTGVDPGPKNMVLPVDETFDAVLFVGYHAKAGTPDAILEHVSTGTVRDFSINGVSMPEGGYNALIAGLYDVPVVFVSGDEAACKQLTALLGNIETVAVKQAIGSVAVSVHPAVARERIRIGVEKALRSIDSHLPYKLAAPYTMRLELNSESLISKARLFPGMRRTGSWTVEYTNDDLLEVMNAFNAVK